MVTFGGTSNIQPITRRNQEIRLKKAASSEADLEQRKCVLEPGDDSASRGRERSLCYVALTDP